MARFQRSIAAALVVTGLSGCGGESASTRVIDELATRTGTEVGDELTEGQSWSARAFARHGELVCSDVLTVYIPEPNSGEGPNAVALSIPGVTANTLEAAKAVIADLNPKMSPYIVVGGEPIIVPESCSPEPDFDARDY